tara:strand:+ start:119 stop:475 length:357 start_codon:yes stop_codon:yes gene_type:complete
MDFYIKHIGDPKYNTQTIVNNGEIEQLLAQIETLLFTNKRDVLGEPNFGCSLDRLIYGLNQTEFQIKNTIQEQIHNYCPLARKYRTQVKVEFERGEVRDICYIDITVNNEYQIQLNVR